MNFVFFPKITHASRGDCEVNLKGKIMLSFFSITVIFGVIGIFSIIALNHTNEHSEELYEQGLMPTSELVELTKLIENTRVNLVSALLYKNVDNANIAIENLEQIKGISAKYLQFQIEEGEKQVFNEFIDSWALFDERVRRNIELITDGQYAAAEEELKLSDPLFLAANEHLHKLVEMNKINGEEIIKQNEAMFKKTRALLTVGTVVALGITVTIALIFNAYLTTHIKKFVNRLHEIELGDLTGDELKVKSKDELSMLANGMNEMQKKLTTLVGETITTSERVASTSEELSSSSEESSQAVQQMAAIAQNTADGADEQLKTVNNTATVLQQIVASIEQVATNMKEMGEFSETSINMTERGKNAVKQVANQMNEISQSTNHTAQSVENLNEKSAEVETIIHMITNIAEQTNLLALNAAIEAARAGEQGKGFAVVAEEVRQLAEESRASAEKTFEIVKEIQTETKRAIEAMKESTEKVSLGLTTTEELNASFHKINEAIQKVDHIIVEVSQSAQGMNEATTQIVHSMNEVSEIAEKTVVATQESSAATEEQLASMEEITSASEVLANLAEHLHLSVSAFKVSR